MLFSQISPAGQAESAVINEMLVKGRVLSYLQWESIVGNADSWRKASAAAGGQFRALDDNYAANKQTPTWASVAIKIFGDKVETDIAHERRGGDVESVHMKNVLRFARDLGSKFQYNFVNANADPATEFNGIKALCAAGYTLDNDADNGLDISYGQNENIETLLATMRELLVYDPTFILADVTFISRLTNVKNLLVTINQDDLGRQIVEFGGVPLVPAGYNGLGSATKTLPATETKGGNSDCQSIYFVKTAEIDGVALASNTGLALDHFGRVESDTCYRSRVEFDADIVLVDADALWRIEGIRV